MRVVKSFKDIHKCRSRIEPGNEYCGVLDDTNYSKKKPNSSYRCFGIL